MDEPLCQPHHLVRRQIQQPVALEKGAALQLVHCSNEVGTARERSGQPGRGLVGELGGRRVDDHQYARLWKCLHVIDCPLSPWQIGREKVLDVGLDCEVVQRIEGGRGRQCDAQDDHPPGMTAAEIDYPRYR